MHALGGFKVQGKTDAGAAQLKRDALALQEAGAQVVLMEAVPARLAGEITQLLKVPTIGIGAGADCTGQVLVLQDMINVYPGRKAKFVRNFMEGQTSIEGAVRAYVAAVKDGSFPAPEHTFSA
ncbi:3-methyl-2-oxobutanoate hydroxymethyltransferase [compost metagenome]